MQEERVAVKVIGVFAGHEAAPDTQFVVLRDDAQREMRVFIGEREAQALSLGLTKTPPNRPLTYEAMLTCLAVSGATMAEVCINDLRDETFYAQVNLHVGEQVHPVDMRPSDALNLAVRADCPFFVSEKVFLACQRNTASSAETAAGEEQSSLEVSEELAQLFAEDQ